MKKLIIFSLALLGAGALQAADYTVYNNGKLGENLHVYGWWNASMVFDANSPSGGEAKVFEFKAADGGAEASAGLNMEAPGNTGMLHSAILNFNWYATTPGATYTIRLTSVAEQDYSFTVTTDNANKWNTTSLVVSQEFPTVATQWDEDKNYGAGYVFSVILTKGESESVIYFDNIYYSNIDESWVAPEHEVVAPKTVPVPTQAAADVLSIFSNAYTPATTFNIGYWSQTTTATLEKIDGKDVYYLRNFNYLGWEFNSDVNVADYDYMHVDFWPCSETNFGFTPISRAGTKTEKSIVMQTVNVKEWNSYDVPMTEWSELDLSQIFQIKFDQGNNGADGYIANVYFWKDENGGGNDDGGNGDDNGDDQPSETGSCTATMTNCWIDGTPQDERVDIEVTLNYSIEYTATKHLAITLSTDNEQFGKVVGMVPQMFVEGAYAGNFEGTPYTFTTSGEYNVGDTVKLSIYCAYNGGSAMFPEFTYTVKEDTTSGVADVVVSENADIYTLTGVKVAEKADFSQIKGSLAPGIYIVSGKKVVVK